MLPKQIGNYGENVARQFLLKRNYNVIAANVYVRYGEIDLIVLKNATLIFFEVKYSRSLLYPEEMYTRSKKRKFLRAVNLWITSRPYIKHSHAKLGLITVHFYQGENHIKTYLDSLY